jgi:hypothetical protein
MNAMVSFFSILFKGKVMTIEFTDKSYILGLWYTETEDGLINYLTAFWKEGDEWKGVNRRRIVKGDKIFDSDDEKQWQELNPKREIMNEEEIIKLMDKCEEAAILCGLKPDRLLVQGNVDKFFELAKTKHWLHMKCEFIH